MFTTCILRPITFVTLDLYLIIVLYTGSSNHLNDSYAIRKQLSLTIFACSIIAKVEGKRTSVFYSQLIDQFSISAVNQILTGNFVGVFIKLPSKFLPVQLQTRLNLSCGTIQLIPRNPTLSADDCLQFGQLLENCRQLSADSVGLLGLLIVPISIVGSCWTQLLSTVLVAV